MIKFVLRRMLLLVVIVIFFTPIIVTYSIGSSLLMAGFLAAAGLALLALYTTYAVRKSRRPKPPQLKSPRIRRQTHIRVTQAESDTIDMHLAIDGAKKAIELEKKKLRDRTKL